MKKVRKMSILIIGIMLCIPILAQNVSCYPNNFYLIGGQEIQLEKNSYIIWNVEESLGFSFRVILESTIFYDDYEPTIAQKNDKFKLSMYQDNYYEGLGEIAGDCLNGKLEFYDFSKKAWYTIINTDTFLLYNYNSKVFYTSLLNSQGARYFNNSFGLKFLLFAFPMSIDFDTYANNTITKTNPSFYNNYTCTSNSINFTRSDIDGGYNYMSLKSNGIVNQWIYNLSSQKIIVEY